MFARLQSYVVMPLLVTFEFSGVSINCDDCDAPDEALKFARRFAAATRRLAKICRCRMYPGKPSTHIYTLVMLGMGRTAGLRRRPQLLADQAVRGVLLRRITELWSTGPIKLPTAGGAPRSVEWQVKWGTWPNPLWLPEALKQRTLPLGAPKKRLWGKQQVKPVRRRLRGKQPATVAGVRLVGTIDMAGIEWEISKRATKRNLQIEPAVDVGVPDDEAAALEGATGRHLAMERVRLTHNRTAQANGQHFVNPIPPTDSSQNEYRKIKDVSCAVCGACTGRQYFSTFLRTPCK